MGAWSAGLYGSDFAQDLRGSVKALARLPFGADTLLEYLCGAEPEAANNPEDSDYTNFWLVAADQFNQRGIDCPKLRARALAIIADGSDLATMTKLGMDQKTLDKRRGMLEQLRVVLAAGVQDGKPRSVLKAPQKLLLQIGEVVAYPICKSSPINPYIVGKDWPIARAWKQDGWGSFVVVESGLVFDFLAWYRPLVITEPLETEPDLPLLLQPRRWLMRNPGTLNARHMKSMELKSVGRISINTVQFSEYFRKPMSPMSCAISDISISNNLSVNADYLRHEAHRLKHGYAPTPKIGALSEIAAVS